MPAPAHLRHPSPAVLALMVVGRADIHSPTHAGSWKVLIVDRLARHGHSSHAFICAHDYPKSSHAEAQSWWITHLGPNLSSVTVDSGIHESTAHLGQLPRLDACFDLVMLHEKSTTLTFTHFLRGRPDAVWLNVPSFLESPRFAAMSATATTAASGASSSDVDEFAFVRARQLLFATPTAVPWDALSSPDRVCLEGTRGILMPTPNVTTDQRVKAQRAAMEHEGVPFCAVVDDQVAFVPRKLAAAFFTATHFEVTGVFKHPDEHTGVGSPGAIAATYGPDGWSFSHTRTCNRWSPTLPQTLEALYARHHNATVGEVRWFGSDTARCFGEACLTSRLVSRLVPFKVAPIPYLIDKMYDHARRKSLLPAVGQREERKRRC